MARGKRRGTIEARGPDRWLVRVSLGRDPVTDRWIRASRSVEGPRKAAEAVLTEMLGKQDGGIALPRGRMTLGEWLAEFDATWAASLAPRTRQLASQSLRLYLPEPIRRLPLARLTPRVFQDLYNALSEAGRAPNTVGYLHRVLSTRLNQAVALGHLATNPLAVVSPPKRDHREYRTLTPTEARTFLEEAEAAPLGALWTVLLMTGIRPEEALGLRWEDWQGAELRIRRALVRLSKGRWELASTKTRKERSIVLPAAAAKALTRHRARQAESRLLLGSEYAGHGLIFATAFGAPLRWENVVTRSFRPLLERVAFRMLGEAPPAIIRKGVKRGDLGAIYKAAAAAGAEAVKRAKLDSLRPYDLRHSAATLLLAAGEHPKVVQEILGHASITLTLQTYSHVVPGMQERAAERLEATIMGTAARQVGS